MIVGCSFTPRPYRVRGGIEVAYVKPPGRFFGAGTWHTGCVSGDGSRFILPYVQAGMSMIAVIDEHGTIVTTHHVARDRVKVIGGRPSTLVVCMGGAFALSPDGERVLESREMDVCGWLGGNYVTQLTQGPDRWLVLAAPRVAEVQLDAPSDSRILRWPDLSLAPPYCVAPASDGRGLWHFASAGQTVVSRIAFDSRRAEGCWQLPISEPTEAVCIGTDVWCGIRDDSGDVLWFPEADPSLAQRVPLGVAGRTIVGGDTESRTLVVCTSRDSQTGVSDTAVSIRRFHAPGGPRLEESDRVDAKGIGAPGAPLVLPGGRVALVEFGTPPAFCIRFPSSSVEGPSPSAGPVDSGR